MPGFFMTRSRLHVNSISSWLYPIAPSLLATKNLRLLSIQQSTLFISQLQMRRSTSNLDLKQFLPREELKEQQLNSTSKIIQKATVHLTVSYHCSTFLGALGSFGKFAFSSGTVSQWLRWYYSWRTSFLEGRATRLGETKQANIGQSSFWTWLFHTQRHSQSGTWFFCGHVWQKLQKYRKNAREPCQQKRRTE